MPKFLELKSDAEYAEAFQVLKELDERLDKERFFSAMHHELSANSKLYAIEDAGKMISVAAVWIVMTGLYEKIFWIHAFVTTKKHRSEGYGTLLLAGLKKVAADYECHEIRVHAHREKAIGYWTKKVRFQSFSRIFRTRDFG